MSERLKYYEMNSEALKPLLALEKYLSDCGLEKPLQELVKLRASQINGCAYCIDMHTRTRAPEAKANSVSIC
jgi:AhpD family alkylhydroperoxidase